MNSGAPGLQIMKKMAYSLNFALKGTLLSTLKGSKSCNKMNKSL